MNLRTLKGLVLYIRLLLPYTLGVTLFLMTLAVLVPLARYMGSLTWPLVVSLAQGAAGIFWWVLCLGGYGGGLLVHRWFQRGQEPFWWNQGLSLPLRLGVLWGVHGAAALAWEVWVA